MAVWTTMNFRELTPDTRFDAEFYNHPGFQLNLNLQKNGVPFEKFFSRVIHPGEFPRGYQDTPGRLFLRAQNVRPAQIEVAEPLYVSDALYNSLPNARAQANELLLVRTGANHGDLARVPPALDRVMVSSHTLRLIPRPETPIHALEIFFAAPSGRDLLLSLKSGGTHGQINANALKTLHLPDLSGLEPQMKAISIQIEALRRQASALYSEAETILNSALGLEQIDLSPRLFYEDRFSQVAVAGRFDAEYFSPIASKITKHLRNFGAVELQTLAKIGTGFPWSSNFFIEDQSQQGEPFIRIRNCKPVTIEVDELDKLDPNYANAQGQGKSLYGDLVVGMDGLKWFLAGLVREPCYINQRVAHIKQVPGSGVSPEFLLICINSLIGQKQLLRVMTIAQTVGHITLNDVRSLLIPQLPASAHDRISEAVKGSCAARKESKTLLNASKRAVEIAIEDGEDAARKFLDNEGAKLGTDTIYWKYRP